MIYIVTISGALLLSLTANRHGTSLGLKHLDEQRLEQLRAQWEKPPPDDFKHIQQAQRPRDVLRRQVLIKTFFQDLKLHRKSLKKICEHARGPMLQHLMRVFKERPIKLKKKTGRHKYSFDQNFADHISSLLVRYEQNNGTLLRLMKKRIKDEFHNFMSKKLI